MMPFDVSSEPGPAASRSGATAVTASVDVHDACAPSQPTAAAAVTRQMPPGNLFPTSIHTLVSAVVKLSRTTTIPPGRNAFRGLGRMKLGSEWFSPDERGARSGVELGFMSTTLSRRVALEYSGVRSGVGTTLEFLVGAVDCGAQLDSFSQYPGAISNSSVCLSLRLQDNKKISCEFLLTGCHNVQFIVQTDVSEISKY
jgi:hypothetical protein